MGEKKLSKKSMEQNTVRNNERMTTPIRFKWRDIQWPPIICLKTAQVVLSRGSTPSTNYDSSSI
jgi:hypothetical protein